MTDTNEVDEGNEYLIRICAEAREQALAAVRSDIYPEMQEQLNAASKVTSDIWQPLVEKATNELLEKWELYQSAQGYDVRADLEPRIRKLYVQLNAEARGDSKDVEGDEVSPEVQWNNLVSLAVYGLVRSIANARWAVNEHVRNEKLEALCKAHGIDTSDI